MPELVSRKREKVKVLLEELNLHVLPAQHFSGNMKGRMAFSETWEKGKEILDLKATEHFAGQNSILIFTK